MTASQAEKGSEQQEEAKTAEAPPGQEGKCQEKSIREVLLLLGRFLLLVVSGIEVEA